MHQPEFGGELYEVADLGGGVSLETWGGVLNCWHVHLANGVVVEFGAEDNEGHFQVTGLSQEGERGD